MSKKWDVYVDPYFPRNLVLVGRKGGSFLESGYVYAPYVPLQVTPTIFGTEDFVPRKGVMTRYAKKMVRPDMVPAAAAGTAFDKVTFTTGVLQGDWVEFHTDGTLWYVEGATRVADGITAA
jgi:hypothetical protein